MPRNDNGTASAEVEAEVLRKVRATKPQIYTTHFCSSNCVWLLQSLNSISLKTNPATGPILPPTPPGNTPLHAPCGIGHGAGLPKPRLSVEQSPCQTEASLQLIGAIQSTAREREKREKRKEKREKRKEKREKRKREEKETQRQDDRKRKRGTETR